jgi:N6-adenosine-specific RNA methylase IME4
MQIANATPAGFPQAGEASDPFASLRGLIAVLAALGGAGVVLIDPPWRFLVRSPRGEGRSASRHYSTKLTLNDLAILPVSALVAPDCWLFLWTTTPMLPAALWLMEQWGFVFSGNGLAWAKLNPSGVGFHMGCGFTTRKNVELCLLGRRGKPRRLSKAVRELIVSPRREHSRKPDEQYDRIEAFAAGPYVELFARQQWPNWFAWGDEVDHVA